MSNFRRLLQASQQEPSYTELEYIECTGTQYIDTGIVANSDTTSFELDYNLLAKSDTHYYGVIGARINSNDGRLHATTITDRAGGDSVWGKGSEAYILPTGTVTLVGDNIITYNRVASKTYYINSTSITQTTESFSTGTTLSLGAIHRQSDNSYMYPVVGLRIKRFKLWENDVAIMDCIPVLNQNGVPCLYDRIAKSFLFNAGTGVFAYQTLTKLTYIESSGTQYIDTGIVANSDTTSFEFDYNLLAISDTDFYGVIGARVNTNVGRLYAITTNSNLYSYWGIDSADYLFKGTLILVGDKILTYNRLAPKTYYINSTSITNITASFSTGATLSLGAIHRQNDNSYIYPAVGFKIKRFKLWDNGELVLDLVPAKDTSNVICMFDLISRKYFYNAGTGVFTGV